MDTNKDCSMAISSVSSVSYSSGSDSATIAQLQKKLQELTQQLKDETQSKDDAKTKQMKTQLLQMQVQQIQSQIQQIEQKQEAKAAKIAANKINAQQTQKPAKATDRSEKTVAPTSSIDQLA